MSGEGLISVLFLIVFKTSLLPNSMSYVRISVLLAKSIIAFSSLKSATICFAPTLAAGQFSVGSITMTSEMCSDIFLAASVSIIPS